MSFVPLRPAAVVRGLLIFSLLTAVVGCQKDEEIRHYTAPEPESPPADSHVAAKPKQRLLGAVVLHGDEQWFFKLTGPESELKGRENEFEGVVDSVTFPEGAKAPDYKVPEKWQPASKPKFIYAAYRIGPEEQAPQMTISQAGGSLAANITRWRNQLGLKPLDAEQLQQQTRMKKVGDATAILVDFVGTGSGKMSSPPFAGGGGAHPPIPAAAPGSPGLKYTVPDGWEKSDELVRGIVRREAVFKAKEGDRSAEVSISKAGGAPKINMDRWRGQVGLKPFTDEEFEKETTAIKISGNPAMFVDLSGAGKSDARGILGAIMPRGRETWFFKMDGPADIVARQKSAFEAFLKSVRFEGGADE